MWSERADARHGRGRCRAWEGADAQQEATDARHEGDGRFAREGAGVVRRRCTLGVRPNQAVLGHGPMAADPAVSRTDVTKPTDWFLEWSARRR